MAYRFQLTPLLRRLALCAFPSPPPFTPAFRQPIASSDADAPSWRRSAAPGPQRGSPWRAWLPLTRPHCPIPPAVLERAAGWSRSCVLGTERPTGLRFVTVFTPPANFMFRIYRGLTPPMGWRHYTSPHLTFVTPLPYPIFPPPYSPLAGFHNFSLWDWSRGWSLSLGPGTPMAFFVLFTSV